MQDHARPTDHQGPLPYQRAFPARRGGPLPGVVEFLAGPLRLVEQTLGLANMVKAGAGLCLMMVLLFGASSAPISSTGPSAPVSPAPVLAAAAQTPDPDNLVFLILGVDSMQDRGRSDTVLVVHLMLKDKKVRILSIPRDTYATIEKPGGVIQDKLNHSYRFGGAELTKKTVEQNLGIKIDYYGVVDYDLFRKSIDLIGCVDLDVEKRFYYVDRAGGLKVDLFPGRQQLCGDKALQYVRFRHDAMGDEGRIHRQQKFLGAALAKLKDPKVVTYLGFKLPSLLEFVTTDVPSQVAMGLLWKIKDLTARDLQMASVPGEGRLMDTPIHRSKLWFFVQDNERLDRLKREWFYEPKATQDVVSTIMKGRWKPVAGITDRPDQGRGGSSPEPGASASAPASPAAPASAAPNGNGGPGYRSPFQPPRANGKKKPAPGSASPGAPRPSSSPGASAKPVSPAAPRASAAPAKAPRPPKPSKPAPAPAPASVAPAPSPSHGAAPVEANPEEGRADAAPDSGLQTPDSDELGRDAVDAALERQPAAPVEVAPPPRNAEVPAVEAPPADPSIDQPAERPEEPADPVGAVIRESESGR